MKSEVVMALFSEEVINMCVDLHKKPGRTSWKYKPLTKKQLKYLKKHIPANKLYEIDRGCGHILLNHLFSVNEDAACWSFPDIGHEEVF